MKYQKYDDSDKINIESGQILNPKCFPCPNELVCIQVNKVFDQVSLRDCVTRIITLVPGPGITNPNYIFKCVDNFDIVEIDVLSKKDSLEKRGYKDLQLLVKIRYTVYYSDGVNNLRINDTAFFNLTVEKIYCPNCTTQIGVIHYPPNDLSQTLDKDGSLVKVEAIIKAFNASICVINGTLIIDIGAFFVIKCECDVELLIPAYGYCPVPPEQPNPSLTNCRTFNDRTKTPFPKVFFPSQKIHILDKTKT